MPEVPNQKIFCIGDSNKAYLRVFLELKLVKVGKNSISEFYEASIFITKHQSFHIQKGSLFKEIFLSDSSETHIFSCMWTVSYRFSICKISLPTKANPFHMFAVFYHEQ